MSYKTILVSRNETYRLRSLLDTAARIGKKHASYVIGLYVIPAAELRFSNAVEAVMVEIGDDRQYFQDQEAAARKVQGAGADPILTRRLASSGRGLAMMVIGTGERLGLIRGYQLQTDFAARLR
jgi:hypothetical protein